MKSFLKHIGFIILSVLVMLFVLDYIYTSVYKKSYPRNKTQYILALDVRDTLDYVFLGSSRVENTIVTKRIEELTGKRAINLGTQGAKLNDINMFLNLLIDNKVVFNRLFVQMDYNFNNKGSSDLVRSQALPYIHNTTSISNYLKHNDSNFNKYYYVPFYKYATNDYRIGLREVFASAISKKAKTNFRSGYKPVIGQMKPDASSKLPLEIVSNNIGFQTIDSICNARNINVTYYCAPFCSNLENRHYLDHLGCKIDNFIDFSAAIDNDKYFQNCSHLNLEGAKLFTELLIKELNL